MEEQVFMNEAGIYVSSTRIEIEGQTFAVRNVGSVKVEEAGRPWAAVLFGIFGAGAMASSVPFGIVLLCAAAYLLWKNLNEKKLVLVSGGGESVALTSTNGKRVLRTKEAIAQAISIR